MMFKDCEFDYFPIELCFHKTSENHFKFMECYFEFAINKQNSADAIESLIRAKSKIKI